VIWHALCGKRYYVFSALVQLSFDIATLCKCISFLMAWHNYVRMRQISRYIQGAPAAKEACQAYDTPNLEFTFCASALAQL